MLNQLDKNNIRDEILTLASTNPIVHAAMVMYLQGQIDWEQALMCSVINLSQTVDALQAKLIEQYENSLRLYISKTKLAAPDDDTPRAA